MVIQELIDKKNIIKSYNTKNIVDFYESPSTSINHGYGSARANTANNMHRHSSMVKDNNPPRFMGEPHIISPRKLTKSTRLFDEQH